MHVPREFPAVSESPKNFDDSLEAAGLVSGLVAAATIPSIVAVITTVLFLIVLCAYIHLRMKMQSNIAALKFATLQSPPISNQTTGNIYESSKQRMDAELSSNMTLPSETYSVCLTLLITAVCSGDFCENWPLLLL